MSEIKVTVENLQQAKVDETVERKALKVLGESFVVDWSSPGYEEPKAHFEDLGKQFSQLYQSEFRTQKNHHSTILSKRLDPAVDLKAAQGGWWMDPSYEKTTAHFDTHLGSFLLRLDSFRITGAGTVQLVLRDNIAMPRIRIQLRNLGASVKPNTIEDDFLNTCTVVLGFFAKVPDKKPTGEQVQEMFDTWRANFPSEIQVHTVSLVRYFDLSLDQYVTIQRF